MLKRRLLEATMAVLMLLAIATNVKFTLAKDISSKEAKQTKSKVIVIDPGHGGKDPGKVSADNILEKDINLQISKELKETFEKNGYEVVMTRTEDVGLYDENDSNKKVADMKARCKLITEESPLCVISIHQNSYESKEVSGAQVFYYKHSNEGAALAKSIQKSLKENVNETNNRQAKYNDNYYLLINTPCPTVIVECGFLSNEYEAKQLSLPEYQKKIADAIYIGFCEYEKGTSNGNNN